MPHPNPHHEPPQRFVCNTDYYLNWSRDIQSEFDVNVSYDLLGDLMISSDMCIT